MIVNAVLADLSTGVVVVQVHQCPSRVATLGAPFPRVDERLGKSAAVGDVVRAVGPLEAIGGARGFDGAVAAAAVQEAGAARSRDRVRDPSCRDGVHERCFPGTCNTTKTTRSHPSHGTTHSLATATVSSHWFKTMTAVHSHTKW